MIVVDTRVEDNPAGSGVGRRVSGVGAGWGRLPTPGARPDPELVEVARVDRLEAEKGSALSLDKVLLLSGDTVKVGSPYVAGAAVKAVVEDEVKGDKIVVFKYKPKKDYRRTQGHRQSYTEIRIKSIKA